MNTMIDGFVLKQTAKAIYANVEGCPESVWIPRSQMSDLCITHEDHGDGSAPAVVFSATIPVWLWNKFPRNSGPIPYATKPY